MVRARAGLPSLSMVRHVVMFTFKEGVTEDQVGAYLTALSQLPSRIAEIRDYKFGRDIGVNAGNYSMVVTGDFDTVEGYLAYRDNPDHQRVVREIGMPLIASRAAVQFEC